MAGIEKILQKIEADASSSCDQILAAAKEETDRILAAARIEGEKAKNDLVEKSDREGQTSFRLAASKAETDRKKAILSTKTGLVNEVIERALEKLKNLPESAYFSLIMTLVEQYSIPGEGVLRFSRKDLDRLPADFEADLNRRLKAKLASVVINKQPIPIDGGFVIVYADIEQNCCFSSLFDVNMDIIKDKLFELLFTGKDV